MLAGNFRSYEDRTMENAKEIRDRAQQRLTAEQQVSEVRGSGVAPSVWDGVQVVPKCTTTLFLSSQPWLLLPCQLSWSISSPCLAS